MDPKRKAQFKRGGSEMPKRKANPPFKRAQRKTIWDPLSLQQAPIHVLIPAVNGVLAGTNLLLRSSTLDERK